MIKAMLMLGMGVAAYGLAQFFRSAIAEERERRDGQREAHDTTRWEGEGGNVMAPQGGVGEAGAAL